MEASSSQTVSALLSDDKVANFMPRDARLHRIKMLQTLACIRNGGVYPLFPYQVRFVNEAIEKGEYLFNKY